MPKLKLVFNPEITWGHILQAVLMAGGLAVLYTDAQVYKERTEARIKWLEENDAAMAARLTEQTQFTQRLSDNILKIAAKLEEQDRRRGRIN